MYNFKKEALSISVVWIVVGIVTYYLNGSRRATLARFPQVNKKIGKKAYDTVMANALRGDYAKWTELTTERLDKIFLEEVDRLTSNK